MLATAVVSEIPYNLAMSGKVLYTTTRNPVVALAIGLAALYFFRRYSEKTFANTLIKLFVGICAVLWTILLSVEQGLPLLMVILVMWALRNKKSSRILFGGAVASACVIFSPIYIVAALGILPVHFYREEEEKELALPLYAIYPVVLTLFGIVTLFL